MLLTFRAKNVRSFRDEMELSMLAGARAEAAFVREIDWRESGRPLKVVPVAGIFGANASGKSNVLEGLDDMRMYVLDSYRREIEMGEHWPFRLDHDAFGAPSSYEIELVLNGIRHEYGFVLDRDRILEEWAFRFPRGRPAVLFSRSGDDIEAGSVGRAETRRVARLVRPNSLFLSAAAAAEHSLLKPLHGWFQRNLRMAGAGNREPRQMLTVTMLEDESFRERLLTMLRAADLGIVDARKQTIDPERRATLERALKVFLGEMGLADEAESMLGSMDLNNMGFSLVHKGRDSTAEFFQGNESQGTKVWLGLIGTVTQALSSGHVLLVDELDASLHPALVAEVVRMFQSPDTNPHRAQMIFNAHDPAILGDSSDDRTLGRDQTWFTEKLGDGSTRLYPLTDFRPRKNEAIGRRYLAGRYGAVPILARQQFDSVGEMIDTDS